jgi:hypothetical protein
VLAPRLATMAQSSLTAACLAAAWMQLGCAATAATTKSTTTPVVSAPSREDKTSPGLKTFLKDRVQHELKTLELQGDTWPVGYTADASILKLDHATRANRDKVSCTVLLTVLDSTHSPVAIVRGNASAVDARSNRSLARDAVGGAAHSAASQLPDVFRQLQKR